MLLTACAQTYELVNGFQRGSVPGEMAPPYPWRHRALLTEPHRIGTTQRKAGPTRSLLHTRTYIYLYKYSMYNNCISPGVFVVVCTRSTDSCPVSKMQVVNKKEKTSQQRYKNGCADRLKDGGTKYFTVLSGLDCQDHMFNTVRMPMTSHHNTHQQWDQIENTSVCSLGKPCMCTELPIHDDC